MLLALMFSPVGWAATTIVGNGDVGNDLEGATALTDSDILEARDESVNRLKALNVSGVLGLGKLIQEIKTSELYMAKKDVLAELPSDQGSFHSNMGGKVFARTEAEPLASTRFFPIAEDLDENQLVALHIHEGLHRALDPKIREDESVVAQITLALTSPNSNFDHVQRKMEKIYKDHSIRPPAEVPVMADTSIKIEAPGRYQEPSQISYEFREFLKSDTTFLQPPQRMHLLQSKMYAFGNDNHPLGLSMELSALQMGDEFLFGPLGIGAQMKAWSSRKFDVDIWSKISLQMLSNEELKKSPLGRDLLQIGVLFSRSSNHMYFENRWGLLIGSDAQQELGGVVYQYEYGTVLNAGIAGGFQIGGLKLGAFADLYLGDKFNVTSVDNSTFNESFGRYRIVSAGPQVSFRMKNFEAFGKAQFLLSQTEDADFNYVGDLLGPGVASGHWSAGFSFYF
jgi:hypothetical protein